ncbi:MAG: hypothetical protein WCO11_08965 [Sphingomonadales bacterium]|jgi:hypothetical protein
MKYLQNLVVAVTMLAVSQPVLAGKPEISGMELQQIQAKDFETAYDVAFPAVMTTLQDSGYRILTAQKDTGLITALGSSSSHLIWAPFLGFRSKKQVPAVSVFIESRGKSRTKIRLSFVMSTGKSDKAFTDEKPLTDPAVYRDAFEKIEKEIFVRQSMDAPSTQPTATPDTPAPAAAAARPPQ